MTRTTAPPGAAAGCATWWRTSRDFRLVFASRTVTLFGSQATEVALLVQARQLTGSAVAVGLLGAVELVPLVVFGLYGGALADRLDRRRLIRWCEAGLGGCAALLLINASLPRPMVWPLYLIAAVMMALAALQRPSLDASVPRIVSRDQLTAAAALLSLSANASVIVGTTRGGLRLLARVPALARPTARARGGGRRGRARRRAGRPAGRPQVRPRAAGAHRLVPSRPGRDDVRVPERAVPVHGGRIARAVGGRADVRGPIGRRAGRVGDQRLDRPGAPARPGHRPGRGRLGAGDHRVRPGPRHRRGAGAARSRGRRRHAERDLPGRAV